MTVAINCLLFITLGLFIHPGLSVAADQDLFRFGKKNYLLEDLETKFQLQLYEADLQAYQLKERIIEEAVLGLYFSDLAKTSQKSVDHLQNEALAVSQPTEQELQNFYQSNRKKIPYPFDQVRAELVRFVSNQKTESRRAELLAKIRASGQFDLLLSGPMMPALSIATAEFFKRGKLDSSVEIVEFADYQCPHCSDSAQAIEKAYASYGSKVKFVFIDFPVLQGISRRLSEAAYCAGQQDKYWEYHKLLFENQRAVKEGSIPAFAKQLNLNEEAFEACLASEAPGKFVDASKQEGERIGVTGTPSVFVNGRRLLERITEEALIRQIEAQLQIASSR